MKKNLIFVALLPALLFTSCTNGSAEVASRIGRYQNLPMVKAPVGSGDHITYLMMSKYGYLEVEGTPVYGEDVEEKFYENCIVYQSDAGADLPFDEVKSKVSGVTFRGFAQYNGNVYPEFLTKVPSKSGETVYAIFDGQSGGGGGGSTPTPTSSYDVEFKVDILSIFDGWEGIEGFSLYVWGANGEEPLGKWDACSGNLVPENEGIYGVSLHGLTYSIVGAVFYFEQTGGEFPGRKQTTDMSISIYEAGTYYIKPTSSTITWNDEGKMTNFTISK